MHINKEIKTGLIQAILIVVYISIVSLIMNNAEHIFGKMDNVIGPVTFLTMFSVSTLVCGLLVFYNPYKLFFMGKKREAINVVVYTTVFLLIILFILFGIMFLF